MSVDDTSPMRRAGSTARRVGRRAFIGSLGALLAAGPLGAVLAAGRSASANENAGAASSPPSQRLRRWTMVIDLRYCDGCQSTGKPPQCTEACIEGHYAPEPMQWIQVYESPLADGSTQFIPAPCQQCQNAPCVNVCPVGATFATPEGVVLIDQQRCIGCRICMESCMYDRRFFNWGEPALPPEARFMEYSPEHQTAALRGTVMKCDFCPDMARAGKLTYCAQACPNNAIYYGDLEEDLATNGKNVIKISRYLAQNSGYRLKEYLGTEPRVHYIPGHGELVGRDPHKTGRKPTVWPWQQRMKGAETWTR